MADELLIFIMLIANAAVNWLERYLLRWRPKQQAAGEGATDVY